jgi:23S rRNA (cytidine1920-2'-O)/16S rRNA (cytidine1409-2'-O)-methyltransferase
LKNGASKVYAVDVGTGQMHSSLLTNNLIELYEKTDIRDVYAIAPKQELPAGSVIIDDIPEIVLIDVSFISLREILPHIANYLSNSKTLIAAMIKPQFEAGKGQTNKGIIKNDAMRRQILRDFEDWSREYFVIQNKRDSDVAGAKGNQERFYILKTISKR